MQFVLTLNFTGTVYMALGTCDWLQVQALLTCRCTGTGYNSRGMWILGLPGGTTGYRVTVPVGRVNSVTGYKAFYRVKSYRYKYISTGESYFTSKGYL